MLRMCLSALAAVLCLGATGLAQAPATAGRNASQMKPAAMVNLNTATTIELQSLPGIGATVAARIVEYRQKQGSFKKIEELMNVRGIGEKSFLKLRSQITVGAKADTDGQH